MQIEPRALEIFRQDSSGTRFTNFMDDLIWALASFSSVPAVYLETCCRVNYSDGGVDTRVKINFPNDPIGFCQVKTIWQYKARTLASFKKNKKNEIPEILDEINKNFSKECIEEGYSYRLAICDEIPSQGRTEIENLLNKYVKQINPNAPKAKLVSIDDQCRWLNLFPTIILKYFNSGYLSNGLLIEAWGRNITSPIHKYIENKDWQGICDEINQHIDFSKPRNGVILFISGNAGVGKTRLVYETLNASNVKNLVIYTNDESDAKKISYMATRPNQTKLIIVADECSVNTQFELNELLKGYKDRVRVIAINFGSSDNKYNNFIVEQMPNKLLELILSRSFQAIPENERRFFASITGGYIRLAADLCEHYGSIQLDNGYLSPPEFIIRYLQVRFGEQDFKVIQALSLFQRIGFKDDLAIELKSLSELCGLNEEAIRDLARRGHDKPGFIATAGRYYYITPEIVACAAFDQAWKRWAENRENEFLNKIPPNLLDNFLKRVALSASPEVRSIVGAHFRSWVLNITPANLSDYIVVKRLCDLVEADTTNYLSLLYNVIKSASIDQLLAINSQGGYSSRRTLVWLCTKLVAFDDFFYNTEEILRRLAIAETEPNLGNNSTCEWQRLFAVLSSGTSIPFLDRFKTLKQCIFSEVEKESVLGLNAFNKIITGFHMGSGRANVISGNIAPPDWQPATQGDYKACYDAIVIFLQELCNSNQARLKEEAFNLTITQTLNLLRWGYFTQIKQILENFTTNEQCLARIIAAVEEFLYFEKLDQNSYIINTRNSLKSISPQDLQVKLVGLTGFELWQKRFNDNIPIEDELELLVNGLYCRQDGLSNVIDLLCSEAVKKTNSFYYLVGKLVRGNKFFWDTLITNEQHLARFIAAVEANLDSLIQERNQYIDCIRDWLETISPQDLHGKVVSLLGVEPWQKQFFQNNTIGNEIESLAHSLYNNPGVLEKEIIWLCSADDKNPYPIGFTIGQLDKTGKFLDQIVAETLKTANTGFGRGYIYGLVKMNPEYLGKVNSIVDDITKENPKIAFDIFITVRRPLKAVDRTIELIRSNVITTEYLSSFIYWRGEDALTDIEFETVLQYLVDAAQSNNANLIKICFNLIGNRLLGEKEGKIQSNILSNSGIYKLVKNFLQHDYTLNNVGQNIHFWSEILKKLMEVDPNTACAIAADSLVCGGIQAEQEVSQFLLKLSEINIDIVFNELLRVMFDEKKGWNFDIRSYKTLFNGLPVENVIDWLNKNGVKLARKIARSLYIPYLNESDEPVVNKLTEFVLTEFGEDDKVFIEFCMGGHSDQMYQGRMTQHKLKEIEIAKHFLKHRIPGIRLWAQKEISSAEDIIKQWQNFEEENYYHE